MDKSSFSNDGGAEISRNYKELKDKLERGLKEVQRSTDSRTSKDILIHLQSEFKGLRLYKEDREELYGRLQQAFDEVNRKIAEERAAFELEAFNNYTTLRQTVEEAIYRAKKTTDCREAKSYLIGAQQCFRGLRLIKENREVLYNELQKAFDEVNSRQAEEIKSISLEAAEVFQTLMPAVDNALQEIMQGQYTQATREALMRLQAELKTSKILKEQRDQINQKIQQAFDLISQNREAEEQRIQKESTQNFASFSSKVEEIMQYASRDNDFRLVREKLKQTQAALREAVLTHEQKDILYARLQEAFSLINLRQDEDRLSFEEEAAQNYKRLSRLVDEGLSQAQESHEYKETREYLKKIQSEFKGIRMVREQREELYSRLQTAFETLRQRLDTYFREKQKNWEVKMNFKLTDLKVQIEQLRAEVEQDEESLAGLEAHLDILQQKPQETAALYSLKARMEFITKTIERKLEKILETETEMEQLKKRLEGDSSTTQTLQPNP